MRNYIKDVTGHICRISVSAEISWCSFWSRSMMLWSLHTENTANSVYSMYYDLFDHDTSTSQTHFVNFAAFYVISDLKSRLEIIRGR